MNLFINILSICDLILGSN